MAGKDRRREMEFKVAKVAGLHAPESKGNTILIYSLRKKE